MKNYIEKIRTKRGISRTELAKMLNMTYQNLYRIENNEGSISSDKFDELCSILRCSVAELFGQAEFKITNDNKLIKVKFYEGKNNYETYKNSELKDLFLPEDFFKILCIDDYSNILCFKNMEKNMEPTISVSDFIVVNENSKKILNNKIYLIVEDGFLKIKRIARETPFEMEVTISSDNQIEGEYPPYKVTIEQAENMILGKVISYRRSTI